MPNLPATQWTRYGTFGQGDTTAVSDGRGDNMEQHDQTQEGIAQKQNNSITTTTSTTSSSMGLSG